MSLPADCVWGQDNVSVSALNSGYPVYGGYYNGPFANMTALKARFPKAYLISIALRLSGSKGSVAVDIEPGTLAGSQSASFAGALAWLRQGGYPGVPVIYVMASWAQTLVNYLSANGFARSSYYLWTAHYTGQHLCGSGCGYLSGTVADGTQYATGANDYNVFRGYVIGKAPVPAPLPSPALGGITVPGLSVSTVQAQLNTWAKYSGFAPLTIDGSFGGKTYSAVRSFQAARKAGLTVTGVVDVNTERFLRNPPGILKKIAPKPAPPLPVVPSGIPQLKQGDNNAQVAAMQYYLRNSGIYGVRGIEADGDFGKSTVIAVKNFQHHAGLQQDGVYGPATAKALSKVAKA